MAYLHLTFIRDVDVDFDVLKRGVMILCGRMFQTVTVRLLRSADDPVSVSVFCSIGGFFRRLYRSTCIFYRCMTSVLN
jgi:hypothetical protein